MHAMAYAAACRVLLRRKLPFQRVYKAVVTASMTLTALSQLLPIPIRHLQQKHSTLFSSAFVMKGRYQVQTSALVPSTDGFDNALGAWAHTAAHLHKQAKQTMRDARKTPAYLCYTFLCNRFSCKQLPVEERLLKAAGSVWLVTAAFMLQYK